MEIGSLGDVIFKVSEEEIKTLSGLKWSGSATVQNHARHMGLEKAEFTGTNLDKITFSVTVSRYFGTKDPMEDIATLLGYEREGKILLFTIGEHKYGRYRWLITSHSIDVKHYTKSGDIATAVISLTLSEYPRR